MPQLKVIRLKDSGYPDVPAMLAQMENWTNEQKFMNQFWRMNNLYKIVDKNMQVVTFQMKPEQADLYVAHLKHPRHVICKSRQLGFSTLIQLLFWTMRYSIPMKTSLLSRRTKMRLRILWKPRLNSLTNAYLRKSRKNARLYEPTQTNLCLITIPR